MLPHPPQFFVLVFVSTQVTGDPHMTWLATVPQGRHVPPVQLPVAGHTVPQPPQLFPSVFRSAHTALTPLSPPALPVQTFWLAGHWQALFTQVEFVGHVLPHPPQLLSSLVVYTHATVPSPPAPHGRSTPGHMHIPPWHGAPPAQTVPHPPQLCESFIGSTHVPAAPASAVVQTIPGHALAPSPPSPGASLALSRELGPSPRAASATPTPVVASMPPSSPV
jgi:hypothetical protein